MLKKLILSIFVIAGLLVLAVWSPWQNWDFNITNLLGIDSKDQFSSLKVKSFAGEIDIFLDGEYVETATADGTFVEVTPVSPGEHTVLLRRRDHAEFSEIIRKINFENNVDVIIGYEIGPTEEFSEGHILFARRSFVSEGNPLMEIFSSPEEVSVDLNGNHLGETPLKDVELEIGSQQKFRFYKDGYDTLELVVLPEDQQERDKLKDMILNLEINLFARPIKIINE